MRKGKIVIILIFILIVSSFLLNKERNSTYIESFIKDNYYSITNYIEKPFKFVFDKIKKYNLNKEVYKNYSILLEIKDKYNFLYNSIDNYKNEIESLYELLDLNKNLDYEIINSKVINRNIGNWLDTITLDKGSSSGINNNDIVINSKGLVGIVINTTKNTSTVKLLTNFDNKISVVVSGTTNYYGLLYNYDSKENTFILEGISSNSDIEKGLSVLTSGIGNIKKGIPIGEVIDIINDPYDLSINLKIKPYVNFNDIYYVSVIK